MTGNRGIGRARMFMGTVLLTAAIITWATALWLSPHAKETAAGVEQVRTTTVVFVRNTAIGTLVLSALSAWMLFPLRRPRKPVRDRIILGVLALLVGTSIYQLIWLRTVLS